MSSGKLLREVRKSADEGWIWASSDLRSMTVSQLSDLNIDLPADAEQVSHVRQSKATRWFVHVL
jgi:hypothetical protein